MIILPNRFIELEPEFVTRAPSQLRWLGHDHTVSDDSSRAIYKVRLGGRAYALKVQVVSATYQYTDQNAVEHAVWQRLKGGPLARYFVPSLAAGRVDLGMVPYTDAWSGRSKTQHAHLSWSLQRWSNLPHLWQVGLPPERYLAVDERAADIAAQAGVASDICDAQFFVRSNGDPYIHDYGLEDH